MKRLFALLMSVIVASSNNIGVTWGNDKMYQPDSYYMISESDLPDYRNIYEYQGANTSRKSCRTTRYTLNGLLVDYQGVDPVYRGYGVSDTKVFNISELDISQIDLSDGYIYAPYDCVLKSHSTGNTNTMYISIKLNGKYYAMVIENMDCWWCDTGRTSGYTTDANGVKWWVHTCEDTYNTRFSGGEVLGKASANTHIILYACDSSGNIKSLSDGTKCLATFKQLYLQE